MTIEHYTNGIPDEKRTPVENYCNMVKEDCMKVLGVEEDDVVRAEQRAREMFIGRLGHTSEIFMFNSVPVENLSRDALLYLAKLYILGECKNNATHGMNRGLHDYS